MLLGSGLVCKVADFGLSRRVKTEDNTGDYYRRYCAEYVRGCSHSFTLECVFAGLITWCACAARARAPVCSTSGIIPVRWTAPEGLTSQKFSSASDVWSFAVVCIEILQDGITPYPDIRSNPEVMTLVNNGEIHRRPAGCTDQVYDQLVRCFSFEPEARPLFADLNEFFAGLVPQGANAQGGISSTKPSRLAEPALSEPPARAHSRRPVCLQRAQGGR